MGEDGEMAHFAPVEELFLGRHFDAEIVVLCVRWYLSFKLSYRDLVSMMGERGILMAYGPNTGLPSFPWSAKRYISSRRLLHSHFGPQPALPNAARTLQTTLQTPQSQMPRTPPMPEFLCKSQWPASPARSGRLAVVMVQHAAQALMALDGPRRSQMASLRADDPVRQTLVVPLGVVVLHKVLNCRPQRRLSEEDHPVQAGLLDAPDKPLGVGIQIR